MDSSQFPDRIFAETVLCRQFEGVRKHYAEHIGTVNKAHLLMLSAAGILPPDDVARLARALVEIDDEIDIDALRYTGEYEDYVHLVEVELSNRLGPDLASALQIGRARSDLDHTVFRMELRARLDALITMALHLAGQLMDKARLERATPIVTYSHGQPAQPSTFGHYLGATIEMLLRDIGRLLAARADVDHCPMGAAAMAGTGFPVDREMVADLLGFEQPMLNTYGAIASADHITAVYSALKLMALNLGRVAQDLLFWSAFEVGQLYVPNSLVRVNRSLAQKRDPVSLEHLRHLASQTWGRCDMVIGALHNTPFTQISDSEGLAQTEGYAAFESAARALDLMAALVPACRINTDRAEMTADAACLTIAELTETLMRGSGLSLHQAQAVACATATSVTTAGRTLHTGFEYFERAFRKVTGRDPDIGPEDYVEIVRAARFIARRHLPGGPAIEALEDAFTIYSERHAELFTALSTMTSRVGAAQTTLLDVFDALAGDRLQDYG